MRISNVRLALLAAPCAVAIALGGGSAWAMGTPSARVRPARNLTDAQAVTVHWRHFDTSQVGTLLIQECTGAFVSDGMATHCDVNPTDAVIVNPATKSGSTAFTVHTGNVGDGTCGTTADDAATCVIAVTGLGTAPPLPVAGQSATAPIRFTVDS